MLASNSIISLTFCNRFGKLWLEGKTKEIYYGVENFITAISNTPPLCTNSTPLMFRLEE